MTKIKKLEIFLTTPPLAKKNQVRAPPSHHPTHQSTPAPRNCSTHPPSQIAPRSLRRCRTAPPRSRGDPTRQMGMAPTQRTTLGNAAPPYLCRTISTGHVMRKPIGTACVSSESKIRLITISPVEYFPRPAGTNVVSAAYRSITNPACSGLEPLRRKRATRSATCAGGDLGMTRLPAISRNGTRVNSRFATQHQPACFTPHRHRRNQHQPGHQHRAYQSSSVALPDRKSPLHSHRRPLLICMVPSHPCSPPPAFRHRVAQLPSRSLGTFSPPRGP